MPATTGFAVAAIRITTERSAAGAPAAPGRVGVMADVAHHEDFSRANNVAELWASSSGQKQKHVVAVAPISQVGAVT